MHRLERERLAVQHRGLPDAGELPGRDMAEARVVALRLPLGRLVLLTKMAAARLLPLEGVVAHQLGELEEVRNAPGVLERLVQVLAPPADVHVLPEFLAQHRDPLTRLLTARGVAGHAASVPRETAQLDRKSTRLNSSHRCISYA